MIIILIIDFVDVFVVEYVDKLLSEILVFVLN